MKMASWWSRQGLSTALGIGVLLLAGCGDDPAAGGESDSAHVLVTASGYLKSSEVSTTVAPSIYRVFNYKITFLAPEGDAVKAGQLLVSFDPSNLQTGLDKYSNRLAQEQQKIANTRLQSEAKLEQLRLTLAEKRADVARIHFLLQGAMVSEGAIMAKQRALELKIAEDEVLRLQRSIEKQKQTVNASIASLSRRVQEYEFQVKQMRDGLTQLNLKAERNGMVVYRSINRAEKPTVGGTVFFGQPLIDIPALEKMMVVGQIAEADLAKVAIGQAVEVVLDTIPDRTFMGEIVSFGRVLRPKSENQPTIIMDSEIKLLEPDVAVMRPGMTARLTMQPLASSIAYARAR